MTLRFAEMEILHILWILPCVIGLSLALRARAHRRLLKYFGSKTLPLLIRSASKRRQGIKLSLQSVVVALMVMALARPQGVGQSEHKVKSGGIELMVLFDVSRSMLAEDVLPDRLSFAKKEVMRLLDMSVGYKVGLVAFAGSSILLSPMTTDRSALKMFLSSLTMDSVSTQGTEFQKALKLAKEAFERGGEQGEGPSVTRAILIVSDGEDHEKGALEMAEKLVEDSIYMFSLAVGTEKGAAIPLKDRGGKTRGYYKDRKSGQVILTKTKGTILRELAKRGRGSFRHLQYGGTVISDLHKDLQELAQSEFVGSETRKYDEKYQWFLGLALLLAILEILLSEKRPVGRIWKGRFEIAEQ